MSIGDEKKIKKLLGAKGLWNNVFFYIYENYEICKVLTLKNKVLISDLSTILFFRLPNSLLINRY